MSTSHAMEFELTFDLYRRAVALHHGWKRWFLVGTIGIGGALATHGIGALVGSENADLLPLDLVFGCATAFGAFTGFRQKTRLAYDSNPAVRGAMTLEVEESAYRVKTTSTDVRVTPEEVHDVKEDDQILVVYLASNAFHVFPKAKLKEAGLEAPLGSLIRARRN